MTRSKATFHGKKWRDLDAHRHKRLLWQEWGVKINQMNGPKRTNIFLTLLKMTIGVTLYSAALGYAVFNTPLLQYV